MIPPIITLGLIFCLVRNLFYYYLPSLCQEKYVQSVLGEIQYMQTM